MFISSSGKITNTTAHLQSTINEIEHNTELFILGDVNINFSSNTPSYRKLQTLLLHNTLLQLINSYTRITNNSKSILDHIYSNSHFIKEAGSIDFNISDHLITYVIRKRQTLIYSHETTLTCIATTYFDIDIFNEILANHKWDHLYYTTDPKIYRLEPNI